MVNVTRELLESAERLRQEMLAAYKRDDFRQAHGYADEIGRLYSPDDTYAAERIAYLIKAVASDFYFGAMLHASEQRYLL